MTIGALSSSESLFLNVKPVKILVSLNDPSTKSYASAISKKVDCTYSHAVRILQRMEDEGRVISEKKGRRKEIQLTEKGEKIAKPLGEALHQMNF